MFRMLQHTSSVEIFLFINLLLIHDLLVTSIPHPVLNLLYFSLTVTSGADIISTNIMPRTLYPLIYHVPATGRGLFTNQSASVHSNIGRAVTESDRRSRIMEPSAGRFQI